MPALKRFPYDVFILKGLTDDETDALTLPGDTGDLGAMVYDSAANDLEITIGANTTTIDNVENWARYVREFLPSQTDDDNPSRPLNSRAVIHSKGFEDWTANCVMETWAQTQGILQSREGAFILYAQRSGRKITAIVEVFDPTEVEDNSKWVTRYNLRNIAPNTPYWRAVA